MSALAHAQPGQDRLWHLVASAPITNSRRRLSFSSN